MASGAKPVAADKLPIGGTGVLGQQALRPAQRQSAHAGGVRPRSTERSGCSQSPVQLIVPDHAYARVFGRHCVQTSMGGVTYLYEV